MEPSSWTHSTSLLWVRTSHDPFDRSGHDHSWYGLTLRKDHSVTHRFRRLVEKRSWVLHNICDALESKGSFAYLALVQQLGFRLLTRRWSEVFLPSSPWSPYYVADYVDSMLVSTWERPISFALNRSYIARVIPDVSWSDSEPYSFSRHDSSRAMRLLARVGKSLWVDRIRRRLEYNSRRIETSEIEIREIKHSSPLSICMVAEVPVRKCPMMTSPFAS